jgi:carbamoylphosphate synthase large subunit
MEKKNILIFPCGSECGLEIFQALQYEKYIEVYGASSLENNPGPFVYENYIEEIVPYITDPGFVDALNTLLKCYKIDFIFPALDSVALYLTQHQEELCAKVISSSCETNTICRAKLRTYEKLAGIVAIPEVFPPESVTKEMLPVFLKPDVGQGSQGTVLAKDLETVRYFTARNKDLLVMEYLPGKEYTIDCFTDRHGNLRFVGGRERRRIKSGIAVNSIRVRDARFAEWAEKINGTIKFRGGWFFQVKGNCSGEFVLMEAASRMAGTSALARNRGVNLPLLSFYDAMELDVSILENDVDNEIDRTFVNRFRLGCEFDTVYCDFDDCLVIREKVNTGLLEFLYRCVNDGKRLVLLTRHATDIYTSLGKYRLLNLFDEVIHITDARSKSEYVKGSRAIFIDDSHRERRDVFNLCGAIILAPDAVSNLIL